MSTKFELSPSSQAAARRHVAPKETVHLGDGGRKPLLGVTCSSWGRRRTGKRTWHHSLTGRGCEGAAILGRAARQSTNPVFRQFSPCPAPSNISSTVPRSFLGARSDMQFGVMATTNVVILGTYLRILRGQRIPFVMPGARVRRSPLSARCKLRDMLTILIQSLHFS